jgi:hypothetical protein
MVNIERLEFLKNKLHDLLSQAEELKHMIEQRDAQNQIAPTDESEASDTEVEEQESELESESERSSWCCCFMRKQKLN